MVKMTKMALSTLKGNLLTAVSSSCIFSCVPIFPRLIKAKESGKTRYQTNRFQL